MSRFPLRSLAILLFLCAAAPAAPDFYLRDGDTVLFHGDSITEGRIWNGFVESYVVTRFPKMNVRFVHHGWGGDQVTGGPGGPIDVRLDRDVIPWKPTVVAIMLGMNDGRYKAFDQQIFDGYSSGFAHIIRRLNQALPGVRITAMRPSPYDEVTRPAVPHSYNAVLVRFGDFVQELSLREKYLVADLNAPIVAAVEKAKAVDPEAAVRLIGDRVHPDRAIHLLMAGELLKAWNAPPVVSSVEIDAAGGRVTAVENAAVTGFSKGAAIRWRQLDHALPMPVDRQDPLIALVLGFSDFDQALNRQPLRITGLQAGRYLLKIDDESVGAFSAEQFARGVQLSVLDTPMTRQAQWSHALMLKHNSIHFFRWRLPVPLGNDNLPQLEGAIDSMEKLEAEYIRLQRKAAEPQPHRFEIVRQ